MSTDLLVAPRPKQDFSVGSQRFSRGATLESASAILRNDSVEFGPVRVSVEYGFSSGEEWSHNMRDEGRALGGVACSRFPVQRRPGRSNPAISFQVGLVLVVARLDSPQWVSY